MAKGKRSVTALRTPKQFRHDVGAETRYAYRPIMQQLGKEARASRQRQRTIGKLYRGQVGLDKRLAAGSAKDYANQAKTYTGFLKAVGAEDTAAGQATQAQQNQIASKYGGKPSTEGAERAQAAAAQRGLSAANYGGYSQQQGAISRSYLRNLASAHKHEGIGQRSIEAQRGRQIAQDRRTALRDRADFATKTATAERASERDYLIQSKAFGETKRSNLAGEAISRTNAGSTRISAKASAKNARTSAQQARYERNHPNAGGSSGSSGGKDGYGSEDVSGARAKLNSAKTGSFKNKKGAYHYLIRLGFSKAAARKAARQVWRHHSGGGGKGGGRAKGGYGHRG